MPQPEVRRFSKATQRPVWEGIIFTGVDKIDDRLSIVETGPVPELHPFVDSIWWMSWDIPAGEKLDCIVVPNPCAKMAVVRKDGSASPPVFVGPRAVAEVFAYSGRGQAIGFEFRPAALFPIVSQPLDTWLGARIEAARIFPALPPVPADWSTDPLIRWISQVERTFLERLGGAGESHLAAISDLMEAVLEGGIPSPEGMAGKLGLSLRSTQRLFQKEIGLSPRDILRIARFNRAIREISGDSFSAFADVALASGFFDQAHMGNEFQKLVAATPANFKRYW